MNKLKLKRPEAVVGELKIMDSSGRVLARTAIRWKAWFWAMWSNMVHPRQTEEMFDVESAHITARVTMDGKPDRFEMFVFKRDRFPSEAEAMSPPSSRDGDKKVFVSGHITTDPDSNDPETVSVNKDEWKKGGIITLRVTPEKRFTIQSPTYQRGIK